MAAGVQGAGMAPPPVKLGLPDGSFHSRPWEEREEDDDVVWTTLLQVMPSMAQTNETVMATEDGEEGASSTVPPQHGSNQDELPFVPPDSAMIYNIKLLTAVNAIFLMTCSLARGVSTMFSYFTCPLLQVMFFAVKQIKQVLKFCLGNLQGKQQQRNAQGFLEDSMLKYGRRCRQKDLFVPHVPGGRGVGDAANACQASASTPPHVSHSNTATLLRLFICFGSSPTK
ncbi:hypothetical protein ABZP36_016481 [Zizania latifolia]